MTTQPAPHPRQHPRRNGQGGRAAAAHRLLRSGEWRDHLVQGRGLQPVGAFKICGAWHRLTARCRRPNARAGVVGVPAPNHGGVAWAAARRLGSGRHRRTGRRARDQTRRHPQTRRAEVIGSTTALAARPRRWQPDCARRGMHPVHACRPMGDRGAGHLRRTRGTRQLAPRPASLPHPWSRPGGGGGLCWPRTLPALRPRSSRSNPGRLGPDVAQKPSPPAKSEKVGRRAPLTAATPCTNSRHRADLTSRC